MTLLEISNHVCGVFLIIEHMDDIVFHSQIANVFVLDRIELKHTHLIKNKASFLQLASS